VAFADPALATNAEGDVGIAFSVGGRTLAPRPGVGILTGRHELVQAAAADPANGAGQGDYSGIQPDWPSRSRFVAAGYSVRAVSGDPNGSNHFDFIRFGRETPPIPRTPVPVPSRVQASTLTLDCGTGESLPGSPHAVSGILKPEGAAARVTITYTKPDATTFSHTTPVVATGEFADTVTDAETASQGGTGAWHAQARFDGDGTRLASTSASCRFDVPSP
jgi:hypothetical protein